MSKPVALLALVAGLIASPLAFADPVQLDAKDDAGKQLSGDPAKGADIFKQCMVCHSPKQGENKVGPSLFGIVGRPAGQVAGFSYSPANKGSGITWSEQELFVYLKAPQKKVPGTKMAFPGLPADQARADVIAYLSTLK